MKPIPRLFTCFFILGNLVLAGFYIDTWNNANTTSRVLPIASYLENGTFQIDKYHELTIDKCYINGHYYSEKAPLSIFITLPVACFLKALHIIQPVNGSFYSSKLYALGAILCAVIPFVIMITLTFYTLCRNERYGVLWAMLVFYGSFLFVYSGTYFEHILAACLLLAAWVFYNKSDYFLCGLMAGMAFLSQFSLSLAIAVFGIQILWGTRSLKNITKYGLGVLPAAVLIMLYNYHFTGAPFVMLYKYITFDMSESLKATYGFRLPSLEAMCSLLFSAYRGLFYYTPLILLMILVSVYKKFIEKDAISLYPNSGLLPFTMLYFLFISSYAVWWGGWCFGPRHLIPLAGLLLYEAVRYAINNKISMYVLILGALPGFILAYFAKITVLYSLPSEVENPFADIIWRDVKVLNFNTNNILTAYVGVSSMWAAVCWLLLFISITALLQFFFNRIHDRMPNK